MTRRGERFTPVQRVLHWLMAVMVLAMLFIGIGMVSTLQPRFLVLIAIHKPLGIAILLLGLLRLGVRLRRGAPPLPADLPWWQTAGAKASHVLLYTLLIVMPLVGWSMLSAGGYPIMLYGRSTCRRSCRLATRSTRCCAAPIHGSPTCSSRRSCCTSRQRCFMPWYAVTVYSQAWLRGALDHPAKGNVKRLQFVAIYYMPYALGFGTFKNACS